MKRDLLTLQDLSGDEFNALFDLSAKLKRDKDKVGTQLKGKSIALVFQKPSNRTRVSFEVGIWKLGGNCIYLGPEEINLGKRESTSDVAKTLSRYLDAIVARTHSHDDIVELGKHASIPIINGLSDLYHPCQALTDLFTIKEKFGKFKGLTIAYVGDGNNVCHSLLLGCAKVGLNISVATPKGYEPNDDIVDLARFDAKKTGSAILVTHEPITAITAANVIYSDVWISMGQEGESGRRLNTFRNYQINKQLAGLANKDYIFMHCLPAHRDMEVTSDVIDGPNSVVFDQAENRMHVQKAILIFLSQENK